MLRKNHFPLIFLLFFLFQNIQAQTITVSDPPGSPFCAGSSILVPFSVSAPFDPSNFFTLEISDVSGSFASPTSVGTHISSTGASVFISLPNGLTSGTGYRLRVRSSTPAVTSNVTNVFTVQTPVGNSNIFGNAVWNVYAFKSDNFAPADYSGFFTVNSISFNSTNSWGANSSPSTASGYVGCPVPTSYYSVMYKRQNFICGFYQMDLRNVDDDAILLVDGIQVISRTCCGDNINVWAGYLNNTSTVEVRLRAYGGSNQVALDITNTLPIISPNVTICPSASTTLSVGTGTNGDTGLQYTWSPSTGLNTINGTSVIASPTVSTTYTVTITKAGSPCAPITRTVGVTVSNAPPIITVNASSTNICPGGSVTLTATGANTYTWSPSTGLNMTTGNTVIATPVVTTTYTVTGNTICNAGTQTITINVGGTVGNPSVFGNNIWNVYCYNGNNFNNYFGFYTEPNLSFYTWNRWDSNASPSSASGYAGCTVPNDQHSLSHKRTGFDCKYYQIDITSHDDNAVLYINGVEVWRHAGCCDTHDNVWRGFLSATSTVEFTTREWGGGSHGALRFVDLANGGTTSSPATICEGSSTNLWANLGGLPGISYAWSANSPLFTFSNNTINNPVGTAQIGCPASVTVTVTMTETASGCAITKTILITVDPLSSTAVSPTSYTVCLTETLDITATGANIYTWLPNTNLTNLTLAGDKVRFTPTAVGTYTLIVSGSNNCNVKDASVNITVIGATLNPNTFGNGIWNVFCYRGNNANPALNQLMGHYTQSTISFDSRTLWADWDSPTSASTYSGCPTPHDNHQIIYKRTNFSCGRYRIDVPNHDDAYHLYINGVLVSEHIGCCDSHFNVWEGLLDQNSTVEFRWEQGNGGTHGGLNLAFAPASATESIWTGSVSTDWFNPLNWCGSVIPSATIDAIIPGAGISNMPIIGANGAVCKTISLATGATLTVNSNFTFNVYGNFQNQGTFIPNQSQVNMFGTSANSLGFAGVNTNFYNLNIGKGGQSVTLQSSIGINNILNLTNGVLDLNSFSLSINNPDPNAIVRNVGSFIKSETNTASNTSKLCWTMDNRLALYEFPLGTASNKYIPVTFDKKTATSTTICISTRPTITNNTPRPVGCFITGAPSSVLVDRWWDISSSVNPLPAPGADITLSYASEENTTPTPTSNMYIQHFDDVLARWDLPFPQTSLGVTTGVGIVPANGVSKFSPFVVLLAPNVLPTSLLTFSGFSVEKNNKLIWEMEQNHNVRVFELQRMNLNNQFETISAFEKSATSQNYEFIDQKPFRGFNYYRLQMLDNEGATQYSNIIALDNANNAWTFKFVPNPTTNDKIIAQILGNPDEKIKITFADTKGIILVEEWIILDQNGFAQWQPTRTVAQGLYIATASNGKKRVIDKVIVR